ncbi:MAG: SMP-30/gluconolactonase/LRE family protein, partial [Oscillospiraceae bacterium]|nr:SMP-30/gluconolactonase/LRE family protein [Oscillospiraceae bacterium]
PDGSCRAMVGGVTCSNGTIWSLDGRTMYYIDTGTSSVVAYDYRPDSGDISNPRVILDFRSLGRKGGPDGMTADCEGNLWIAEFGGWTVGCWDPAGGRLVREVEVGASKVTSCAFGGGGLDVLYITTARMGLSEAELLAEPDAGSLFAVRPGVKGVRTDLCAYKPS